MVLYLAVSKDGGVFVDEGEGGLGVVVENVAREACLETFGVGVAVEGCMRTALSVDVGVSRLEMKLLWMA